MEKPYERERETHVKQTNPIHELYWKEREILAEKAKLLAEGKLKEPKTEWLGMRLTHTVKEIYRRAPENVKNSARRAFEAVLLSWFIGSSNISEKTETNTFIFNININSNVAEAKPNVSVKVDLEPLARLVERLYELRKPLPPTQRKLVEELYHTIRKLN